MSTYKTPAVGVYVDYRYQSAVQTSARVIDIAIRFGREFSEVDKQVLADYAKESGCREGPTPETAESMSEIADECCEWLNGQETTPGLYWAFSGEAGGFGLFIDIESAKENADFVSTRKQEWPPEDDDSIVWFLHINERGNCEMYECSRNEQNQQVMTGVWSLV